MYYDSSVLNSFELHLLDDIIYYFLVDDDRHSCNIGGSLLTTCLYTVVYFDKDIK